MINIPGKVVKKGKDIFDKLDSKVNFTIPENLLSYQGINGKKDDRDLELTQNNFRLQIGKMKKNEDTIYSKDILLPALEYLIKKTGNNEIATIQLRPDLAKFLINEDQKESVKDIMSFEEEKLQIQKLIKRYFKNKGAKIEIISVAESYPEVFSLLKEKGSKGLETKEKPEINKDNISVLNIIQYLYRIRQHNNKFSQLLYNTKTSAQKESDTKPMGENESDYYSLVEVGIRFYEVLSGIYIQGGIDRQTKYDRIIGGIIQGKDIKPFKIKDYPELEELHNIYKQINPEIKFDRLYIETKDVREMEDKKIEKNKLRNKVVLYTNIALLTVLSAFGGYKFSEYKQQKEKEKTEETFSKEALDNSYITFYGTHTEYPPNENLTEKQKYLNDVSKHMYYYFCEIYGTPNDEQKKTLISIIKNELLRKEDGSNTINIERFFRQPIDPSLIYQQDFFIKNIIPNNEIILNELGLNPIPYNHFLKYKQEFKATLETKGDIILNSNTPPDGDLIGHNSTEKKISVEYTTNPGIVGSRKKYKKEYIGSYYDYRSYKRYHFIKIKTEDKKDIILASNENSYNFTMTGKHNFSLNLAKEGINKIMKYWEQ